jgi:hypothetical protein
VPIISNFRLESPSGQLHYELYQNVWFKARPWAHAAAREAALGPSRHFAAKQQTVAFGCKADIPKALLAHAAASRP